MKTKLLIAFPLVIAVCAISILIASPVYSVAGTLLFGWIVYLLGGIAAGYDLAGWDRFWACLPGALYAGAARIHALDLSRDPPDVATGKQHRFGLEATMDGIDCRCGLPDVCLGDGGDRPRPPVWLAPSW